LDELQLTRKELPRQVYLELLALDDPGFTSVLPTLITSYGPSILNGLK